MQVFLFSDDLELINKWEYSLKKLRPEIIYELQDLLVLKDSIIVLNLTSVDSNRSGVLEKLRNNNNKLLLLDRTPTLSKAKLIISLGVSGYGNAIMSKVYLQSSIEAIKNNLIWLMPDLSSQLILELSDAINTNDKHNDILNALTPKETEIALLVKNGFSNYDISKKMNISINTVKTHIKHIYEKLQVHDKISLTLLFKN